MIRAALSEPLGRRSRLAACTAAVAVGVALVHLVPLAGAAAVGLVVWRCECGCVPGLALIRALGATRRQLVAWSACGAVPAGVAGALAGSAAGVLVAGTAPLPAASVGSTVLVVALIAACVPALRTPLGRPQDGPRRGRRSRLAMGA